MKDKRMFKLSNSRVTKLATKFMVKRRSIFVAITWLVLVLNPVSAFSWGITNISPNPVQYGCVVTLTGSFESQGNNTVRFWLDGGQKYVFKIKSWSGSVIKVDTFSMANGNFWVGVFSGNGIQLTKSAKTLQVTSGPCTSSSSKPSIRPKLGFGAGIKAPETVNPDAATEFAVKPKIKPKPGIGSGTPGLIKIPRVDTNVGLGSGIQAPEKVKTPAAVKFALIPMIQQVESSDGDLIKPGAEVRITGVSFGKKGKVLFRIPGFQDEPRELYNVGWVSGFEILGTLPSDLLSEAQVHAKAEYKVISSMGRHSQWFAPSFRVATRPATRLATKPMIQQITAPDGIGLGKDFVVEGMGFGSQPGNVVMRIAGVATDYAVQNLRWDSSWQIRATIPKNLGKGLGIKDMELRFRVTKHDGQKSAWYNIGVDSTVEILLPLKAVAITHCGGSDYDLCGPLEPISGTIPWRMSKHSVRGFHRQELGRIGNDKDYDVHNIRLDNGWVISRVEHKFTKSSGDESISPSLSHAALVGKNEVDLRVDWSVSPADNLMYEYKIWIKGPIGLPYRCKYNLSFCDHPSLWVNY